MIPDNKIANAVSGRTARACDCCIRRRARWYCAADDAFLCQACDGSVHSANPLARRHERVRLTTASASTGDLPSWQRGLTRKARTPRHGKHHQGSKSEGVILNPLLPTVPELGAEDTTSSSLETDEQLLYRVPIFDPFVDSQNGYESLDMELEEFAADVETLLGKGLDEESYGIEELGLLGSCSNKNEAFDYGKLIKAEKDSNIGGEAFDFGFEDYDDQDEQKEMMMIKIDDDEEDEENKVKRRKKLLRLDYEAISVAWATQSEASPWINGQRPQINPLDCWPHYMGTSGIELVHPLYGDHQHHHHHYQMGGNGNGNGNGNGMVSMGDGEREARVTRYREKRRTRLFAKKIRYQVRKLNAEKRPRMKGRFVKRSSLDPSFPLLSK